MISSTDTMRNMIDERNELYKAMSIEENKWMQEPLEQLELARELEPAEPPFYLMIRGYKDVEALWKKYKSDFEKLGIRINQFLEPMKIHTQSGKEAIVYEVSMNLDDISELPIDYKSIIIFVSKFPFGSRMKSSLPTLRTQAQLGRGPLSCFRRFQTSALKRLQVRMCEPIET